MPASTSKLGPGLSLATRSTEQQARCSPHRLRARPPGRLLSAPAEAAPLVQPLLPRDLELAAPLCTQHRLLPCRLCTPSRLCLLHCHTGLHTSAALRWLLAVTPGLGPRGRMRKAGASAPGSTMHPSKRGRPDSDVGRCQVLKELVGEQRQDGRRRLGRARAGCARWGTRVHRARCRRRVLGPDSGSILCAWGTRSVPRKLRLTLHGVAERRSGGTRAPQGLSLRLSGIAKGPSAGQGRPHPRCPNAPAPPGSPCSPPPMCTRLFLLRELWRPRG